jgi:hypothetical protein
MGVGYRAGADDGHAVGRPGAGHGWFLSPGLRTVRLSTGPVRVSRGPWAAPAAPGKTVTWPRRSRSGVP